MRLLLTVQIAWQVQESLDSLIFSKMVRLKIEQIGIYSRDRLSVVITVWNGWGWFRNVRIGSVWFRMVRVGSWSGLVQDGQRWFMVRVGSGWSALVHGQGWFSMVSVGSWMFWVGLLDGLSWNVLYLQWLTISLAPTFFTPQSEQK